MLKKSTLPRRLTEVADIVAATLDMNGCLIWLKDEGASLDLVACTIRVDRAVRDTRAFYATDTDTAFITDALLTGKLITLDSPPQPSTDK